jgi:HK97 gp10 family phage protein
MKAQLTGFENLQGVFNHMDQADKRKIMLSAFKKAVKPTEMVMRDNAPHGKTGNLRRSIGTIVMKDQVGVYVGARIKGGYKGYHGHIVEEGTVQRFRKTKNNAPTGKMRYKGFVRAAVKFTEPMVLNTVRDEWDKAIERFIIRRK